MTEEPNLSPLELLVLRGSCLSVRKGITRPRSGKISSPCWNIAGQGMS